MCTVIQGCIVLMHHTVGCLKSLTFEVRHIFLCNDNKLIMLSNEKVYLPDVLSETQDRSGLCNLADALLFGLSNFLNKMQ